MLILKGKLTLKMLIEYKCITHELWNKMHTVILIKYIMALRQLVLLDGFYLANKGAPYHSVLDISDFICRTKPRGWC